jgi:hypothetical protein
VRCKAISPDWKAVVSLATGAGDARSRDRDQGDQRPIAPLHVRVGRHHVENTPDLVERRPARRPECLGNSGRVPRCGSPNSATNRMLAELFAGPFGKFYAVCAGATFFQFGERLKICPGALACLLSMVKKNVIWSAAWPLWWAMYATDFQPHPRAARAVSVPATWAIANRNSYFGSTRVGWAKPPRPNGEARSGLPPSPWTRGMPAPSPSMPLRPRNAMPQLPADDEPALCRLGI